MTFTLPPSHSSAATWLKLCVATVAVGIALILFRVLFVPIDGIALSAFGSFVIVIGLSVGIYYLMLFGLNRVFSGPVRSS